MTNCLNCSSITENLKFCSSICMHTYNKSKPAKYPCVICNNKTTKHRKRCRSCIEADRKFKITRKNHNIIDSLTRICSLCKEIKPKTEFYKKYYKDNSYEHQFPYCKPCWSRKTTLQQIKRKKQMIEYKGGKCFDCGVIGPAAIYDFHHLDPSKKDFKIGKSISFEKAKLELDKCVLLCANCHRTRHIKMSGTYELHLF